jgi:hypothetical protein
VSFPKHDLNPNNTLKLANDLFPALLSGDKRVTIRKGVRNFTLGRATFQPTVEDGSFDFCNVFITSLATKPMRDVTDAEAQTDGFRDAHDLFEGLRAYYPNLAADDYVTIVNFVRVSG